MKSQVRKTLLDAARTLLRSASIYDLSVGKMAAEAGVARPTAYRYFSHPRDVVGALAEETLVEIRNAICDTQQPSKAAAYARAAVEILTSDSTVNRQVILHASVQARDGKWIAQTNTPEGLFAAWDMNSKEARISLTYFRGAMYSWATGFFSDKEFAEETERAIAMRDIQ